MSHLVEEQRRVLESLEENASPELDYVRRNWILEELVTTSPLVVIDALAFTSSVLASSALLYGLEVAGPDFVAAAPGMGLVTGLLFIAYGLYPGCALNAIVELRRVVIATTIAFASCAVFVFGFDAIASNPLPLLVAWFAAIVALPCARGLGRAILARTRWWGRSAILVGTREHVESVLARTESMRTQGVRPTPFITSLGDTAWRELDRVQPRWLIVCSEEPWMKVLTQPVASDFRQVSVLVPSLVRVFGTSWIEPVQIGATSGFHVRNRLHFKRYAIAKRVLDYGICCAALPVLIPLIVTIALCVKLTSKGPVFFGHRRLGRDGREITIWKFRTMVTDAPQRLQEYLTEHPELAEEWEATHKLRDDPRVTKIGNFLRKSSLDELPQLWSVIIGQMSLVGPRPIVADEIRKYGDTFTLYTRVTPGITGLWQVSGRNDTSYPERVELDAAYVRNWSIWLDLYVLFRTVKTVIRREGAC